MCAREKIRERVFKKEYKSWENEEVYMWKILDKKDSKIWWMSQREEWQTLALNKVYLNHFEMERKLMLKLLGAFFDTIHQIYVCVHYIAHLSWSSYSCYLSRLSHASPSSISYPSKNLFPFFSHSFIPSPENLQRILTGSVNDIYYFHS